MADRCTESKVCGVEQSSKEDLENHQRQMLCNTLRLIHDLPEEDFFRRIITMTNITYNIAICGSMSQYETMKRYKRIIEKLMPFLSVTIPKPLLEPWEDLTVHQTEWMRVLDESDVVYILKKPNGTIGDSTRYELSYCKYNSIKCYMITPGFIDALVKTDKEETKC